MLFHIIKIIANSVLKTLKCLGTTVIVRYFHYKITRTAGNRKRFEVLQQGVQSKYSSFVIGGRNLRLGILITYWKLVAAGCIGSSQRFIGRFEVDNDDNLPSHLVTNCKMQYNILQNW